MSRLIKKILILLITVGLGLFVSIIVILWTYSNKLPDYKFLKNYKPPVSSKLYSGGGELVSDFSSEKRIFVPYKSIPKKIILNKDSDQFIKIIKKAKKQIESNEKSYDDLYQLVNSIDSF